jgi:hypothetical protein
MVSPLWASSCFMESLDWANVAGAIANTHIAINIQKRFFM